MITKTLHQRLEEATIENSKNTVRQTHQVSLESLDQIIEDANRLKYEKYQENPSLANKQAAYNCAKNCCIVAIPEANIKV